MKDGENENMKEEREKESWNLQHWLHGLGIPWENRKGEKRYSSTHGREMFTNDGKSKCSGSQSIKHLILGKQIK